MNMKKLVMLVGALVIAVVCGLMVKNIVSGAAADKANAAPAVPQGPKVLVARKPLAAGMIIDQESLAYQPWPQELIESAYYIEGAGASPQSLIGTVVRYPVTAGQPVTRGALIGPEDRGFLAAALGPGMRAIAIGVTAQTAVAGFIFPGDHVDVVLTQDNIVGGGDGPPLKASETIVRNVRVLATDQNISGKDDDGKPLIKAAENVTVEVTPQIAEKIAIAQQMGTLSLVLRSLADNESELERAVASGDVKLASGGDPAKERKAMVSMVNRPADSNTTVTTGGDVSRFQRRTVPGRAGGAANSSMPVAKVAGEASAQSGPVVRVARGVDATAVPVGSR